VAQWAVTNHLDGVDFDLENLGVGFTYGSMTAAQVVQWMVSATTAARQVLGSTKYISHAPQGPYIGPVGAANTWAGTTGGYTGVWTGSNGAIDFYNIQFYNQGATCYVDYNGLFLQSCSNFPSTSVSEIHTAGIPLNAIVVGKIVTSVDGGSGFVDAGTLNTWFSEASANLGWGTGVMGWVWQGTPTATWINTIYPVSANSAPPVTSLNAQSQTVVTSTNPTTLSPYPSPTGTCAPCLCGSEVAGGAAYPLVTVWISLLAILYLI